jgi:hypothetical protein
MVSGEGAVMTTLEIVPKKTKPEPSAEELAAKELVRVAREQGLSLTGPDRLLKQFTKSVLETALNVEMTEHLGHKQHRALEERDSTNGCPSRNSAPMPAIKPVPSSARPRTTQRRQLRRRLPLGPGEPKGGQTCAPPSKCGPSWSLKGL